MTLPARFRRSLRLRCSGGMLVCQVAEAVLDNETSGKAKGKLTGFDQLPFAPMSFRCAPEEIRTPNLLIRSQMLYPLSYGRMPDEPTAEVYTRPNQLGLLNPGAQLRWRTRHVPALSLTVRLLLPFGAQMANNLTVNEKAAGGRRNALGSAVGGRADCSAGMPRC